MIKRKTFFLIFAIFIINTSSFAKPRCDTAHLDICARELIQGAIDSGTVVGHWEGGNYLTGKLVVEHFKHSYLSTVHNRDGLNMPIYIIDSSSTGMTESFLHTTRGMTYYFAGSWHTVSAPMAVPTNLIGVPGKVPQPKPIAVPPKIVQKTPTPMTVPTNIIGVPGKVPQPKPIAVPGKIPQAIPTPTIISHTIGTGNKHSKITLSNTHKPVTIINYNKNHKVTVSSKQVSKKTNPQHTVSLQVAKLHYKDVNKIDATNVNQHLISTVPGDNLNQNHNSILIDHNDKAWRCKVSGLGHRNMKSQGKEEVSFGHAETMHFRNSTFNHISNNIAINNNCLISVSK